MIINISEAANLAFHALAFMVNRKDDDLIRVAAVAKFLNASEAHLNKVLQRLKKAEIVRSMRGPGGGFALDVDPKTVTLLDVFEVMDGPLPDENCILGQSDCVFGRCLFGDLLTKIHGEVKGYFSKTTLSDLDEALTRQPFSFPRNL